MTLTIVWTRVIFWSQTLSEQNEDKANFPNISKGHFAVAKVPGKTPTSGRHYLAHVEAVEKDGFTVRFHKRVLLFTKFAMPDNDKHFSVNLS